VRSHIPSLVLCGFLAPVASLAGEFEAPSEAPLEAQAPPQAPPPAKPRPPHSLGAPKLDEGIRITAALRVHDNGHDFFRGFVDIQAGDLHIQADEADVYEVEKLGGVKSSVVVAVGNVVFIQGEERISGDRLTMDVDSGQGLFEHARGYVQPGVFVESEKIERVNATTYRVTRSDFTACCQPNPRWGFTASSATIEPDEKIVAKNVVLKVKSVPVFYIPYIWYPIRHDQRSTGFLLPSYSLNSDKGFGIAAGFFWAMGRSADQTFTGEHYATFGDGFGHEFRYVVDAASRGSFRSYIFNGKRRDPNAPVVPGTPVSGNSYSFNWNALQALPLGFRANLKVDYSSSVQFQQNIQNNLDDIASITRSWSAALQRSFGVHNFQAQVDSYKTFYGDNFPDESRHLPSIRLFQSPQKVAWPILNKSGLVFGYDLRADKIEHIFSPDNETEVQDHFTRLEAVPTLSRPVSLGFLSATPQIEGHYTHWSASQDGDLVTGPPLERSFAEASLAIAGPSLSRVFNNPSGWYSEKFKHVFGPEITFRYRSQVSDELNQSIPRLDPTDILPGTKQVQYGIVQHFYAKRPNAAGKLETHEFLSWRVARTYYFDVDQYQANKDREYSSSSYQSAGPKSHDSPLQSQLSFTPARSLRTTFNLEYNIDQRQLLLLNLSQNINLPRVGLQAAVYKAPYLQILRGQITVLPGRQTFRGSGRLEVIPNRLSLDGGADYDFTQKQFLQRRARARLRFQCFGLVGEIIKTNFYNGIERRQINFSVELAHIGSIGNFMGQDPNRSPGTFGGLR